MIRHMCLAGGCFDIQIGAAANRVAESIAVTIVLLIIIPLFDLLMAVIIHPAMRLAHDECLAVLVE